MTLLFAALFSCTHVRGTTDSISESQTRKKIDTELLRKKKLYDIDMFDFKTQRIHVYYVQRT